MKSAEGDNGDTPLKAWVRALAMTAPISRNASTTLPILIENLADRFGTAPALLSDQVSLSYSALAERCNRYSRWALAHGVSCGDVVCLLMPNCPDYMAIWLGVTRIGGIVALINTNLAGNQLVHAINLVASKHAIAGGELVHALAAVLHQLSPTIKCWAHGELTLGFPRIDDEIQGSSGDRLHAELATPPSIMDQALYIYTSGTTGLPKAANISHFRLMQWSHWFAGLMDTRSSDRMYNCLPMYHGIGGVVATGAILVNGGSIVIRQQFSASQFWDDILDWNCTLFQYIGELCRYLVQSPPNPREVHHHIRLCCGNGLRPDIWQAFQRRFHISRILEFYGATESNFSLYNCEGKLGSIGRIPSFLAHRFPLALIRCDFDTGEPVRTEDGWCIPCSVDEAGEAIGKIIEGGLHPASRFEGYTDPEASEEKILRNAFASGDTWFRSGDLMRRDKLGYFYFIDRMGDTFRWKGENVSTTLVADTITMCTDVIEAVVYGVTVPNTEGRAGMAAVVVNRDFDLSVLQQHLVAHLPDYARPLFLRVRDAIETTGTFKPKSQDLSRAGYDPTATDDALYFYDRERAAFLNLDAALYALIRNGNLRL
jgi:fatty-acyl-CoA synthase